MGDEPIVHNQLRLSVLHFGKSRVAALVSILADDPYFPAAASRLLGSDALGRRTHIERARRYDDEWFTEALAIPFDGGSARS